MPCSDPRHLLADQYRDASNLNARARLPERFGTNPYPWHRWVSDQLDLSADSRSLELGCGPGALWRENRDRVPTGWDLTLTDFSPGMPAEAEVGLGALRPDVRFAVADAQAIPHAGGAFDTVTANHTLYHVPDRARALGEIARVRRAGGALYAATNGRRHLGELASFEQLLLPDTAAGDRADETSGFSLRNGAERLGRWFADVALRRREDALVVTEVGPLVAYLLSASRVRRHLGALPPSDAERRIAAPTAAVERSLATDGGIRLSKGSGLLVARRVIAR